MRILAAHIATAAEGDVGFSHKGADLLLGLVPDATTFPKLEDEVTIAQSCVTEGRWRDRVNLEECLDVREELSHSGWIGGIYPTVNSGKHRTFPGATAACDISHVKSDDEDLSGVRAALREAMERKGMKPKPLSRAAGLGDTAVRDILEERTTSVKVSTLRALARPLDLTIHDLLGARAVPITGRVGAGGTVEFAEETGDLATVLRPPGIVGALEAAEVVGDSMLPRYSSGDVVYFSRHFDGMLDEYFGEFCIARLRSGETYVKLLARGSKPGFVTLRSLNAADLEDVELEWATPIVFVLPSFARRMLRTL